MKWFFGIAFVGAGFVSYGQTSPAIESLINAERNFAASSKELTTRQAFLQNLTDSSLIFQNGQVAAGKEVWLNRSPDSSLLFWWPVYTGISDDENFGFTTGPWEWSSDRSSGVPDANGYFATVWERKPGGSWKVAADIGVSFPRDDYTPPVSVTIASPDDDLSTGGSQSLLQYDEEYVRLLNERSVSLIPEYFAGGSHILRNGHQPWVGSAEDVLRFEAASKFQIQHGGGKISASGDVAFTYGNVTQVTDEAGKHVSKNLCYMRVWIRERNNWRIAIDVIGGG